MQYKIPQNVQVEDRIIGPITMRRLIILSVGGGITYLAWLKLSQLYYIEIWIFPVGILGFLTFAFAFLEPLGMRFGKFCLRLFEFFLVPRRKVWDKRFTQNAYFSYIDYRTTSKKKEVKTNIHGNKFEKNPQKMQDLTNVLDFKTDSSPISQK
jgi:hypothetical protein